MNLEDLDNPDWVPDEVFICPSCEKAAPFQWDPDQECWWPGTRQWWHIPEKGIRFLCSKTCYLKLKEWPTWRHE